MNQKKQCVDNEVDGLRQQLSEAHSQNDNLKKELSKTTQVLDHFRQSVNNSPNAIFSINRMGHITTWNPACCSIFQYDNSIVGKDFRLLLKSAEDLQLLEKEILGPADARTLSNVDLSYKCHDGEVREMVSRVYPVVSSEGYIHGFVFANTDVTERNQTHRELDKYRHHLEDIVEERTAELKLEIQNRKAAQKGLQVSYDSLITVLDSMDLAIQVVASDKGKVIFMNSRLRSLLGERTCLDSVNDLFDSLSSGEKTKGDLSKEASVTVFDEATGRWFLLQEQIIRWLDDSLVRLQTATDITERKKIDEELKRVEKLDSLGVLAGGIAHDFNNLLTGVTGSLSLLKYQSESGNPSISLLDSAVHAVSRATSLTQQLLTFSKGGEPVKSVVNITGILREAVEFSLRGTAVRLDLQVDENLSEVEADEGQLSQVFYNLVINAKQTMPEGGVLTVTAKNHCVSNVESSDVLPVGKCVQIDFADSGPGIPSDILNKIFDPYFTTKEAGEGLGLATVHAIIAKHNGKITASNTDQGGARFRILLPTSEKPLPKPGKSESPRKESGGRILLMDDEEMIREVAEAMLIQLGYSVDTVTDGELAIEKYRGALEKGQPYDAVIFDLTIPGGMGGKKATERLTQIDPQLKAIASSGYSGGRVLAESKQYGFCAVLQKPYHLKEMASVLHKVLFD